MKPVVITTLFSFLLLKAAGQSEGGPVYSRLAAYSPRWGDAFSFGGNEAALADIAEFSAGVYSERPFLLPSLSRYHAGVVLPTKSGHFGMQGYYAGNAAYSEAGARLAYARRLGAKVAAGVAFGWGNRKAAGYGSAAVPAVEAGVLFQLSEGCTAGLHVSNPMAGGSGKAPGERPPGVYTAGLGYAPSVHFFMAAEAQKEAGQPVSVNAGLQYAFGKRLVVRAGLKSGVGEYYFGSGVWVKDLRLDITASVHPQLGITPGLGLLYAPKKEEK